MIHPIIRDSNPNYGPWVERLLKELDVWFKTRILDLGVGKPCGLF